MIINDLFNNKKFAAEAIGDLGSKRDQGKSIRRWRKSRGLDEQGVAEGVNHSALQGWDEMDANQKTKALQQAGFKTPFRQYKWSDKEGHGQYTWDGWSSEELDDILHAAKVKELDQADELTMSASDRRGLQRQAKQDFEAQRQQLHKEKMEMERFAWEKANTEAERKHEIAKIEKEYLHDLRKLQMGHQQDMEKILHADTHELNKMKAEFNMRQAEREKAKPESELQDEPAPQPSPQANFDPDTGEPIRPQANQWHTSQQLSAPTKPPKPNNNDDIVDVEPKPNKPLAIKEKVSIVRDPEQATGIQRTGGVTSGSVYMPGKPRPQSVPQNAGAVASSRPSAMNSQKPLMAVSLERWKESVLNRYPEARFATQKMINGATIATDRSGKVGIYDPKNSYAKVGPETQKIAAKGSLAEEASPMISPPANRFDNKREAFDHAKQHGGKVFKSTYTDPNTGIQNIVFVVKKEQGMAEDDDAVAAFLARGGQVQRLKPAKPRKGERWQGSAHIGAAGGRGTKGQVSGLGANTGKSGKPVVTAEQGVAEANNDTGVEWFDFATWVLTQGDKYKDFTTNHTVHQAAQKEYKAYVDSRKQGVSEVSLGDYGKKAMMSRAMAQTNRFFDRDDPTKVAAADRTIANRTKGLASADARRQPYTPPAQDAEKMQRDLTAKYPNIDELVRRAELNRDPNYERADGQAYYAARDAEQNYLKLKQIQRVIQGLNESLNRSHLP